MAGGKETPRQKMIGLMYLVLTAMLALNVSKAILKGYLSVNDSLEKTKKNIIENNKRVTEAFKNSIAGNKSAEPYYNQAVIAAKDIDGMFKYVDDIKGNMMRYTLGFPDDMKVLGDTINLRHEPWVSKIDDYDKPTTVLLGVDDMHHLETPLSAGDMKKRLEALHAKLNAQLDNMQKDPKQKMLDDDYKNLKKKVDIIKPVASGFVEDKITFTWEMDQVDHLPMAAVFVNLNKIQADLKNVEAEILQVFSSASGKLAIKPNRLFAISVAPSSYILAGQEYTSDIFLTAAFTTLKEGDMEVMMGADSLSVVKGGKGSLIPVVNGQGKYKSSTGAPGDQKYQGVIKFKKPDGSFEYYPFKGEYKVAKAAASVAADYMNVFYRGVENPVSASAAGISPSDIQITASGAGVKYVPRGEPGKYMFSFTGVGECLITVSAKTPDGVKPQGPPIKFKVKPLPKPEAKVGGKYAPPEMKRDELSTVGAIGAGASGFDFQANYITQSYDLVGKVKGKLVTAQGNGANLSDEAKAIFKGADIGTKIYIDIRVKGPDGIIYPSSCAIKVNK